MLASFFQSSSANRPPLRVGLILDEGRLTRHGLEVVCQIRRSDFARLELIVIAASSLDDASGGWCFNLYRRWDRRHVDEDADPIRSVDSSADLAGVPRITMRSWLTGPNGGPSDDALRQIRDARLDVLVDLKGSSRPSEFQAVSTFGVWSLRHAHGTRSRGGQESFWEVYEANPLSGGELQARGAGQEADVLTLCRCVVATSPGLSWARNRHVSYWAANSLVIQKLHELYERGWDEVRRRAVMPAPDRGVRLEYSAPTNWEMVRWLVPTLAGKAVKRLRRRATQPEWRLAVRRSDRLLLDRVPSEGVSGFHWLQARPGRHYADPFLAEYSGKTWAFFEDIDRATGRGRISASQIESHGRLGEVVPILTRPHHLSYPCIFEDSGEWFMIPETSSNGTVELHRCRRFPDDWVLECVLFRGRAVDTTVWIEDGRHWFFTTLVEPRSLATQLWLFVADAVTGPWTPHPENPISMDVRNARGAGAVFRQHGKLYRPSQDCSGRYGRTFSLNEIERLTPDHYVERPVVTVEPMAGFVGTHTYARCGDLEMIDGCALVPA